MGIIDGWWGFGFPCLALLGCSWWYLGAWLSSSSGEEMPLPSPPTQCFMRLDSFARYGPTPYISDIGLGAYHPGLALGLRSRLTTFPLLFLP